jgi:hypothetical protein
MTTYRADEPGTARRTYSRSESRTAQAQEPAPAAASTALSGTLEARSSEAGLTRTMWMWRRLLGGPTVLTILVRRLGTGQFLDAVRTINGWSLAAATGIAALTTVSCTWRRSLVARSLGVGMPMRAAVPAYYRSQFLNTTLPSGVLGDVHRAVRHGRVDRITGANAAAARAAGNGVADEYRRAPREGVTAWGFSVAGSVQPRARSPLWSTASWCSSPTLRAPLCSARPGSIGAPAALTGQIHLRR